MAESSQARQTFVDMARSLGLIVVAIGVLLLIGPARKLILPGDSNGPTADYLHVAAGFTESAGAQAVLPASVPSGWRANAATLTGRGATSRLHIGWATDDGHYVGLDETVAEATPLLRDVLGRPGLAVQETIPIDAATWDVRRSARGETALTTAFGAVTVVVTGDASGSDLRQFASSLR